MSAVVTGAVVGAIVASSAVSSGPSEPLSQSTAVIILVMFALSLVGGAVCASRSRWDKWENLIFGSVFTFVGLFLLLGLAMLIATAVGV